MILIFSVRFLIMNLHFLVINLNFLKRKHSFVIVHTIAVPLYKNKVFIAEHDFTSILSIFGKKNSNEVSVMNFCLNWTYKKINRKLCVESRVKPVPMKKPHSNSYELILLVFVLFFFFLSQMVSINLEHNINSFTLSISLTHYFLFCCSFYEMFSA